MIMRTKGISVFLGLIILLLLANSIVLNAQTNVGLTNSDANSQTKNEQLAKTKKHLTELLSKNLGIFLIMTGNENFNFVTNLGFPQETIVFEDRIEFVFKDQKNIIIQTVKLYFSYILEDKIKATVLNRHTEDGRLIYENHLKLGTIAVITTSENTAFIKLLSQDLSIIRDILNEIRFKMDEFENMAAAYHQQKVKPTISEEQRRFIIQANSFAQIMEYDSALDQYIKALAIDQTSYPEAYLNIALLLGQTERYFAALNFMKKYFLLVPNPADLQKINDKKRGWEIMLKN